MPNVSKDKRSQTSEKSKCTFFKKYSCIKTSHFRSQHLFYSTSFHIVYVFLILHFIEYIIYLNNMLDWKIQAKGIWKKDPEANIINGD